MKTINHPNLLTHTQNLGKIFFYALSFCFILSSCKQSELNITNETVLAPKLPSTVLDYESRSPLNGFSNFQNVTVTNNGATLGRVLFYDKKLSVNNATSCGSCHKQINGFADNTSFSRGFESRLTKRNTPAITNPGQQWAYFWDNRQSSLTSMVMNPIANHIEMGLEDMNYLVDKIKGYDYYKPLFTNAFGSEEITSDKIASAMAQFLSSMNSNTSKYKEGTLNNFANYNSLETMGKNLFFTQLPCGGCHNGNTLGGSGSWANIGLDVNYSDPGITASDPFGGGIVVDPFFPNTGGIGQGFTGNFKIPSLLNVALTAPYMHDGRFNTLDEVVNFYSDGIQANEGLSVLLTEGGMQSWNGTGSSTPNRNPARLNLTSIEKKALVAFLNTCTDNNYINDVAYSDPFK